MTIIEQTQRGEGAAAAIRERGYRAHYDRGRVIMPRSDFDHMLADTGRWAGEFMFGATPVLAQPDWMFEPLSVAQARFIAVLRVELRRTMRRWHLL